MPEPNIIVQGTPNPNAAKFTVDRTLIEGGAGCPTSTPTWPRRTPWRAGSSR